MQTTGLTPAPRSKPPLRRTTLAGLTRDTTQVIRPPVITLLPALPVQPRLPAPTLRPLLRPRQPRKLPRLSKTRPRQTSTLPMTPRIPRPTIPRVPVVLSSESLPRQRLKPPPQTTLPLPARPTPLRGLRKEPLATPITTRTTTTRLTPRPQLPLPTQQPTTRPATVTVATRAIAQTPTTTGVRPTTATTLATPTAGHPKKVFLPFSGP